MIVARRPVLNIDRWALMTKFLYGMGKICQPLKTSESNMEAGTRGMVSSYSTTYDDLTELRRSHSNVMDCSTLSKNTDTASYADMLPT